jgi:hypothetical protein
MISAVSVNCSRCEVLHGLHFALWNIPVNRIYNALLSNNIHRKHWLAVSMVGWNSNGLIIHIASAKLGVKLNYYPIGRLVDKGI